MANATYLHARITTQQSQNTTTLTTKQTVSSSDLSTAGFANNDEVLVIWYFKVSHSTTNETRVDLTYNTATIMSGTTTRLDLGAAGRERAFMFMERVSLGTLAAFEVKLADSTTTSAYLEKSELFIVKLADFGVENTDWFWNKNTTVTQNTTTYSGTNRAAITWTPPSVEDWIYFAYAHHAIDSASVNAEGRVVLDGALHSGDWSIEGESTTEEIPVTWFAVLSSLAASEHTLSMETRDDTTTAANDHRESAIFLFRKNKWSDIYTNIAGTVAVANGSDVQVATITNTLTVSQPLIIWGQGNMNLDTVDTQAYMWIRQGGSTVIDPLGNTATGLASGYAYDATDEVPLSVFGYISSESGAQDIDLFASQTNTASRNLLGTGLLVWGMAKKNTYKVSAQAQAHVKSIDVQGYAQSEAYILVTSKVYAQAQTGIVLPSFTYKEYAQSLGAIKQTYPIFPKILAQDTFTEAGTGTTELYNHTPEVGGSWDSSNVYVNKDTDTLVTTYSDTGEGFLRSVLISNASIYFTASAGSTVDYPIALLAKITGDINPSYYMLLVYRGSSTYWEYSLDRVSFGGPPETISSGISTVAFGNNARMLFFVSGYSPTTLKVKVWAATDEEPNSWLDTQTDNNGSNQHESGYFGLALAADASGVTSGDDLLIISHVINPTFAQSQASVKSIVSVWAQGNSYIKVTGLQSYAQAQSHINRTEQGYAQAQTSILRTGLVYAQAQSIVLRSEQGYAQSQADIKQGYNVYAQAAAIITITVQAYAQAQTETTIPTMGGYGYAQALGQIGRIEDLYTAIDEVTADDNDYIVNIADGNAVISLGPLVTPDWFQDHVLRVRYQTTGTGSGGTIQLRQGTTIIWQTTGITSSDWTLLEYALNSSEIASITDYTDLNIKFETSDKFLVSWVEFQVPYGSGAKKTRKYAQAEAFIYVPIQTLNVHAQAQVVIFRTEQGYAQANAWLKVTDNVTSGQAQAQIKTTSFAYANAQGTVLQTYLSYATAQGQVLQSYLSVAQTQAIVKVTTAQYANAQSQILQTYPSYAQAQTYVKTVDINAYAQAQTQIKSTYQAYGQAAAKIILSDLQAYAQAQAWIKQTYQQWAQANAYIQLTGLQVYAQANAQIKQVCLGYAQAQAQINATYLAFAQANASIILSNQQAYAQAEAQIKATYTAYAQANAYIQLTGLTVYAQAQVWIKTTYFAYAQAQAKLNAFGTQQYAQAAVWIEGSFIQHAQAQAKLNAFGTLVYAQAQASILQTYVAWAQGNAYIILTNLQVYAQAQAVILATYQGVAQAQAFILLSGLNAYAQAGATTVQSYSKFAQAQAKLNAYDVNQYAQAAAWIAGAFIQFAQAQVKINAYNVQAYGQAQGIIKSTYIIFAQAQVLIRNTYQNHAQAQVNVKAIYQVYAQTGAAIKTSYYQVGQAQTQIKSTYLAWAQAEARILATYQGYANALAQIYIVGQRFANAIVSIKTTYSSPAQAQTLVYGTWQQHASAQTLVKTGVNIYAQAQAYVIIRNTLNYAQSQVSIVTNYIQQAQALATILATSSQFGQAEGIVAKLAGYGQAETFVVITHILKKLTVSDTNLISVTLSDTLPTQTIDETEVISVEITDTNISLEIADYLHEDFLLSDSNY
jgi:hypothetical protein